MQIRRHDTAAPARRSCRRATTRAVLVLAAIALTATSLAPALSTSATAAVADQASQPGAQIAARLAVGSDHTCVIVTGGKVRCWGEGDSGRLGYGNTNDIGDDETPAIAGYLDLGPGKTAKAISAGTSHTCAILNDNTVRCWGAGNLGQLGYGNTDDLGDNPGELSNAAAVPLGPGKTAKSIAAGNVHTCAILNDNTVRCWGDGTSGKLGYGNTNEIGDGAGPSIVAAGPVPLPSGKTAKTIAAGRVHTCAILNDNSVRCWGRGENGRLGYGSPNDIGDSPGEIVAAGPVPLPSGKTARAISAGGDHTCAILNDNTVRCWGSGEYGQLGYGNNNDIGDGDTSLASPDPGIAGAGPVALGPGKTAKAITASDFFACAILNDDSLRCWGFGGTGALGYGNTLTIGDNETPNQPGPIDLGAARTADAVDTGFAHTCAVLGDGTVRCWGKGDSGDLGQGTTTDIGDTETPGSVRPVDLANDRVT